MARVVYGPIDRERIRVIRKGFGWVDHRFVRGRFVDGRSPEALALYLFLVTVADAVEATLFGLSSGLYGLDDAPEDVLAEAIDDVLDPRHAKS